MGVMRFIHRMGSPEYFYDTAGRLVPWFGWSALALILLGLVAGLGLAPADYQQGDGFRIIYIHVPAAWLSLFVYVGMTVGSVIYLVWHTKMTDVINAVSAPIGASFTFLTLVTGSLWGKPMWGTWWVWDARLTSELVLLFIYFGIIALRGAIEDPRTAAKAVSILTIVGAVNVPIVKFSVDWWNTLHQGATVFRADGPAMTGDMLMPLLVMALGFTLFFVMLVLMNARCEVLYRERASGWVRTRFGSI